MNALTVVSTDLLTPLGAYLRLRERGRASFLLESVEHGRLGRHSFVVAGSKIVDFAAALTPRVRTRGRAGEGAHPGRRRLPDRPLAARRAADVGERTRAVPVAAPRQPVPVPVPARARRPRAGRLLAGDARQSRRPLR